MGSLADRFAMAKEGKLDPKLSHSPARRAAQVSKMKDTLNKSRENYTPKSEDDKFKRKLFKESVRKYNSNKLKREKYEVKRYGYKAD